MLQFSCFHQMLSPVLLFRKVHWDWQDHYVLSYALHKSVLLSAHCTYFKSVLLGVQNKQLCPVLLQQNEIKCCAIRLVIFYSHLSCSLHWIAPLTRRGTNLYYGGADPVLRSGPLIRPRAPLLDLSSKTLLNLANATPWNFRTAHLRCWVGCGKQFHICFSFEIKIFEAGPDSHN